MFVVDSAKAKEDYGKIEAECLSCLTRHGAAIVKAVKWDDRKLAYDIRKVRRGTFILAHFNAPSEAVARIERQCALNENILRVLILVDEDGVEVTTFSIKERDAEGSGESPV
jgi:small subunit ribosomal protein S6